jgi:hypothetical protein
MCSSMSTRYVKKERGETKSDAVEATKDGIGPVSNPRGEHRKRKTRKLSFQLGSINLSGVEARLPYLDGEDKLPERVIKEYLVFTAKTDKTRGTDITRVHF